jgi:hypothetical protein
MIWASSPPNEWRPPPPAFELSDHCAEIVGDLADGLAREHVRAGVRLGDGVGIVGPPRGQRCVSRLLEQRRPPIPAAGEQPQAVAEDDKRDF